MNDLELYIKSLYPSGLEYDLAAQLCIRLYSTAEGIPDCYKESCQKENLASVFSSLTKSGVVNVTSPAAAKYGANFHSVSDKGHWIEVLASVFKLGDVVNEQLRAQIDKRISEYGKLDANA